MNISKTILKKVYRKRPKDSHKGDYGSLLVIGGSKLYSGSPGFAALAAYRSGVDLVTIASPERAANIVAKWCPDMITYPLKGDFVKTSHVKELLKLTKGKDAVVIGGGMGREGETLKAIRKFLKKVKIPCVIDADAIYAVNKNILKGRPFIITPHRREFKVLTGEKVKTKVEARKKQVKKAAKDLGTTLLLKGNLDIISDGKRTAVNKTGCPEMTVGGTGDILTGIIGSLIAQRNDIFPSACAAAYINGKAGEIAVKIKKRLMASDLLDTICKVL